MKALIKGALVVATLVVPAVSMAFGFSGIVLSEKYKEKVIATTSGFVETPSGSFKGSAAFNISDSLMLALDENSTFSLTLGDFEFEQALGQDPNYVKGKTSATLQTAIVTSSGTLIIVKTKLNWSSGILFAKFKGITPFAASPVAASLVGTSVGSKSKDIVATVDIDAGSDHTGLATHSLEMDGALTRKTKNVDGIDYELDKINLLGVLFT